MLIAKDWLAISLGTSDTIMMGIEEPTKMEEGHVLVHPTDDNCFMGLLWLVNSNTNKLLELLYYHFYFICSFRNGSLVRDIFKRSEGNNNWEYFSELLESTPRGNYGSMGE